MTIKLLPDNIINQIAAGEVIENPSSVVKELVENSIDAKATEINVIIEKSGKNLILVKDNGSCMSMNDIVMCIKRHATSKLDITDLHNINSFGFRGEAIPSIASVSKMRITSRRINDQNGSTIYIEGGIIKEKKEIYNCNPGTTIEIYDLFFLTPARLKFLKNDKIELSNITSWMKKNAISNYNISFSLQHNDRKIFSYIKQDNNKKKTNKIVNKLSMISSRIQDIYNSDYIDNMMEIKTLENANHLENGICFYGFTSLPTFNKSISDEQIFFVNGRIIKDKIFNIALKIAYQDVIPKGRYPLCFLFIDIPNNMVDINVHPAKSEVRFINNNIIRNVIIRAIRESLLKQDNNVTSSHIGKEAVSLFIPNNLNGLNKNTSNNNFYRRDSNIQSQQFDIANINRNIKPSYIDPVFDGASDNKKDNIIVEEKNNFDISDNSYISDLNKEEQKNKNNDISDNKYKLGFAKCQIDKTYIISQTVDELIITDQHAAHERISYESLKLKIKDKLDNGGLISQNLLAQDIIKMNNINQIDALIKNKEQLNKLGLLFEIFNDDSVIVKSVPDIIGDKYNKQLILDIADNIIENKEEIVLNNIIDYIAKTYSCHHSIRAGRELSIDEMNYLLRKIETTNLSAQCNHGRPSYIKISMNDIEKLFERT
ncbi:MAG TPA: DNA mismatch repair endonuclease MutL [Candidatus Megaira endosymbiont of Hartmannula sinica]|nr:DNA mismatch repair endonuclease MutL [Candidatus Megaera endosymbiont of Hartmannula sinica]